MEINPCIILENIMSEYSFDDLRNKNIEELLKIKNEKTEELTKVDKECMNIIGSIMYLQDEIKKRKEKIKNGKQHSVKTWNCCQMNLELDEACPICAEKYED
jgi:hypothetical protein